MKNSGQSLIEVIFSIGILALVLVAVVSLLLTSLSGKSMGFERKKAKELAEMITEEVIALSKNDPLTFWRLEDLTGLTKNGYDNYVYSIGFTNIVGSGCGVGTTDCAEMVIKVGWSGKENNELIFNRFFSRK